MKSVAYLVSQFSVVEKTFRNQIPNCWLFLAGTKLRIQSWSGPNQTLQKGRKIKKSPESATLDAIPDT